MRNQTVTLRANAAFHSLSDPTRRALLDLLRKGGPLPAGEIAGRFPVSRPAISKHLRVLRKADLVHEYRRGRHRFYQINPQPLRAVDRWLSDYRVFWKSRLQELKEYVEAAPVPNPRHMRSSHHPQRRERHDKS
jgi:DNA-binding transcriptional ArsR family regulator